MRPLSLASIAALLMLGTIFAIPGCGGGSGSPMSPALPAAEDVPASDVAPSPTLATTAPDAGLGHIVSAGGVMSGATGLYRITVDPDALTATVDPVVGRSGQATDDQYELDVALFFGQTDFEIVSVTGTDETLDITYRLAHPFAAPTDLTAPASSKNRADLGISGRVLYLTEVPTAVGNSYFTNSGSVIANTSLIKNADGYLKPEALIENSGFLANCFPYRAMVNEARDPRIDALSGEAISNGGADSGNFDPTFGWQRVNMGANRTGWTGYGILHQGQAVVDTVSLDRDALSAGFSFDVALIAKYTDPRGGGTRAEKLANRLPAHVNDIGAFTYREPFGALDGERVSIIGASSGFVPNTISSSVLSFHLTDWDARATETSLDDLSEDPALSHVQPDTAGFSQLSVCIPGVLGNTAHLVNLDPSSLKDDDSAIGGDAAADAGTPSDPLYYEGLITKTAGAGQVDGLYPGLLRVADPEVSADRSGWYEPLDASALPMRPLPAGAIAPEPVIYQAFQVAMFEPNIAPQATFSTPPTVLSGTASTTTVQVSSLSDPDNQLITVEIDWDGGSDNFVFAGIVPPPYAPLPAFTSPTGLWVNHTSGATVRTINVRYSDGAPGGTVYAPELVTTLSANRPPQVSGGANVQLSASNIASGQSFIMNAGTVSPTSVIDPEGDAIIYRIYDTITPGTPQASSSLFPIAGLGPYANPPVSQVTFTTYATDTLHPTPSTATALTPTRIGTVTAAGLVLTWGSSSGIDSATDVAINGQGDMLLVGSFTGTADFDPGPGATTRTSAGNSDAYLLSLSAAGEFQWVVTWGGSSNDVATGIRLDASGQPRITGTFIGTADFNPGASTTNRTSAGSTDNYCLALSTSGIYQWVATWGSGNLDVIEDFAIASTGAVSLVGSWSTTIDFNPGVGVVARTSSLGSEDGYCLTLTASGAYAWVSTFGGTQADSVTAIALTSSNLPILAGVFSGTADFDPGVGSTNRTSAGSLDAFCLGLTSDGGYSWVETFGGVGDTTPQAIALTSSNAIRLAGSFSGTTDFNPGGGVANKSADGDVDAFVLALTAGHSFDWVGVWEAESAPDMAIAGSGNLLISGAFTTGCDFDPGVGSANRTSNGSSDGYCLSLSSSGSYQWVATWGNANAEAANALALTEEGAIRIPGQFLGTVDFDPGAGTRTLTSGSAADAYLIGLTATGTL